MNSTSSRRPQTAAETQDRVRAGLARRYRAERRFRAYGIAAITFGVAFVIFLMVKAINTMRRKEAAAPVEPAAPTTTEALLTEIRDALKAKK